MGSKQKAPAPRKVRSILSPETAIDANERAERRRRLAALQQLQATGRDSTVLTDGKLGG